MYREYMNRIEVVVIISIILLCIMLITMIFGLKDKDGYGVLIVIASIIAIGVIIYVLYKCNAVSNEIHIRILCNCYR